MQYLSFSIISIELEAEHRIFMRETISRTDKGQPRPKYIFNKMCVVMPYFITFLKLVSVLIQAICIPQCVSYRYNSLSNTRFLILQSVSTRIRRSIYSLGIYLSRQNSLQYLSMYQSRYNTLCISQSISIYQHTRKQLL